jgi:hypothetical protein
MRPRWGSNPGLTDRLIVGRNVTLTFGGFKKEMKFWEERIAYFPFTAR